MRASPLSICLSRLPQDEPFTLATAQAQGCTKKALCALVESGHVRRPVRNLYVSSQVPDTLLLRARMLALVVPSDCFVCDRTAAWLHGAPAALAPNEHLSVPQVSCFRPSDEGRLRNALAVSGERAIRPRDLMQVHGIVVTTPLRTALDLGRLQRTRDLRLAGMDAMVRLGHFSLDELLAEVPRFARQRGVVLLRALAPLVDAGAQSPGESALRLRWYDAGLPRPRTQVPVVMQDGSSCFLDLGVEDCLFAAEYDGEEWHSTPQQLLDDRERRGWIREHRSWVVEEYRKEHVYGQRQNADLHLREAFAAARASYPARAFIL